MREKAPSALELVMAINGQEARLRQAMLRADLAALDELIADDLIFATHLGQVVTKAMDLDAYRSGRLRISTLDYSETEVRPLGEIVLVVTRCHLAGHYDGVAFAGDFRFTRLWRRSGDAWKIAAGHCSAIA